MNDFIKRNSPVFVIGIVTLVVFIIITIVSQFKKSREPELVSLTTSQVTELETTDPRNISMPTEYEADKKYGILEIEYTQQGFVPQNARSFQNQLVRWTNATDTPLNIVQLTNTYPELKDGISIKPGETFEFRLYKPRLWSYEREDNKDQFGTIFVVENQ